MKRENTLKTNITWRNGGGGGQNPAQVFTVFVEESKSRVFRTL